MFSVCHFSAASVALPTWNPSDKTAASVLSNANLTDTVALASAGHVRNLTAVSTGSNYVAIKIDQDAGQQAFGVCNSSHSITVYAGSDANGISYDPSTGSITSNGAVVDTALTATTNDVIGIYVLFGSGVQFYKNGAAMGTGFMTLPTGALKFMWSKQGTSAVGAVTIQPSTVSKPAGATYWPA